MVRLYGLSTGGNRNVTLRFSQRLLFRRLPTAIMSLCVLKPKEKSDVVHVQNESGQFSFLCLRRHYVASTPET